MSSKSLGFIKPETFSYKDEFVLESGKSLKSFDLIYETYGSLSKNKDNAILICHALSGNHHAAGFSEEDEKKAGWWNELIGPDKIYIFLYLLITDTLIQ